jgi:hypothetical protein
MNITIHSLKSNERIIKTKWNYLQKIIKGPASFELGSDRKHLRITLN